MMLPGPGQSLPRAAAGKEAAAFCAEMLPLVSRTFALSIEALPPELREAVRCSYLLCRIVDTLEDSAGLALDERMALFALFDELLVNDDAPAALFARACSQALAGAPGEDAERQLCCRAGLVFTVFRALAPAQREAIRPHVQEMSAGMRQYVVRGSRGGAIGLASMEDLERYCYFVAGTVGKLLTTLFCQLVPLEADARSAVEERAVSFGLGLQLVNIVKDAAGDLARGVCYLPRGAAARLGLPLERLLDPERRDAAIALVRAVSGRAREHLERALQYTQLWPLPQGAAVRLFCVVPLALAMATLDEVERGEDTLMPGRNPRISRETVFRILREAELAVSSDQALERLFGNVAPSQPGSLEQGSKPRTERGAAPRPAR